MLLIGVLAALALALSAIGVYGIIAYSVCQRRREIRIRVALGAPSGAVISMLVRQGLAVALAGLAIGIAAALAATRLLAGVLYGITPHDPLTFGGVAALFVAAAAAAGYFPGRRATRGNPLAALRIG
jgi:ABC-type antimicrobial peptide transport system permease subunit